MRASPLTVSLWAEAVMDAYPCWLTERLFIWAASRMKRWVWAGAPKVRVKHRAKWEAWRPAVSGLTFRRAPTQAELREQERLARLAMYQAQQQSAYRQLASYGPQNSGVSSLMQQMQQSANHAYLQHPRFLPGQWVRLDGN